MSGTTHTFTKRNLLEEYEVYNITKSPSDANRLMFDALYFPTNTYRFGSIDVTLSNSYAVAGSFTATDGLTGRINTLVILPDR